ncbi:MAG: hypothetical protein KDA79_18235 [Planctomycetaceae bacterium]|nr:hypothetical protein [Planctomycetaceae bacterium]
MTAERLLQNLASRARQDQPPRVDVRAAVRRGILTELPGSMVDWPLVTGALASLVAAGIILAVSTWSFSDLQYPGLELVQTYETVLP